MKIILTIVLMSANAMAATSTTTYFSCKVKEPLKGGKTVNVTVKFAVKGLDLFKRKGELVSYPGVAEDEGAILVTPKVLPGTKDRSPKMFNLNGQGGDLRLEGGGLRLWGDGAGYQFTDLVVWDLDSEETDLEGYVRDYGPAYGKTEIFKQFIKCARTSEKL